MLSLSANICGSAHIIGTLGDISTITAPPGSDLTLNAGSSNQNVILKPTGTGGVLLGTTTNNANGILQLASATSSSAGIAWGADTTLYRSGANQLTTSAQVATGALYASASANNPILIAQVAGTSRIFIQSDGSGNPQIVSSGKALLVGAPSTFGLTLQSGGANALVLDASQVATFSGGVVGTGATGGSQGAGTGNFSALYVNGVAVGTSTGNVSTTGSPANTQLAIFNSGTVIKGLSSLTTDGSGNLTANTLTSVGTGTNAFSGRLNLSTLTTGTVPLITTVGAGGSWQIGQNAGNGTGDDTFSIYSNTYGGGHASVPIALFKSTDGSTTLAGAITGPAAADFVINSGATSGDVILNTGTAGGIFRVKINGSQFARFSSTALILNSNTDNSNGVLQLASATSNASGIAFGSDTVLYRAGAAQPRFEGDGVTLDINTTTSNQPSLRFVDGGVVKGSITTAASPEGLIFFVSHSPVRALTLDGNQNVVVGSAAIATNATDGFFYIETCAGTPTGTPTAFTGRVPMVYDTTNNKLWIYRGGAWAGVVI